MVKKCPMPNAYIKYAGIFDLDNLIRTIYDWLVHQDYEVHEKEQKHKVPTPRGAEDEIHLWGWRKINGYVKYFITIDIRIFDLNHVDVVKEGVKKKMQQGRMEMMFSGYFHLDYNDWFEKNKFTKILQEFYHKFLILQFIHNIWEDELYYREYKLHRVIKEQLGMETPTNASEGRW